MTLPLLSVFRLSLSLLTLTLLSAADFPKPAISAGIEKGSKEIRGTISRATGTLELQIDGNSVVPLRHLVDAKRLEFELELETALKTKNKVRLRHVDGADSSEWVEKTIDPSNTPAVAITAVEALYGSNKIRVFFAPLEAATESASVEVTACEESRLRTFSAEDLKKTSVEITLDRRLFCGALKSVTLTALRKGADQEAEAKATESQLKVLLPVIRVDEPVKEGDATISGLAGDSIGKVWVRVYSGWHLRPVKDEAEAVTVLPSLQTQQSTGQKQQQDPKQPQQQSGAAQQATKQSLIQDAMACTDDPVQSAEALVDSGRFTAQLGSRLNAADCVVVEAIFPGQLEASTTQTVTSAPVRVKSVLLDWGRVRGYFSVGGAVSHYQQQFSQVDTFIGFTADTRVLGWILDKKKLRPREAKGSNEWSDSSLPLKSFRAQLNLFTEARVSVRLADVGTGTTGQAGGVDAPPDRPDQLNFGANQPGYFQVGLHAPISVAGMDWYHNGQVFSLFAAPIVKFGGQTNDKEVVLSRRVAVDASKPSTDAARFAYLRNESRKGVLPFYGYGFRFGLFRYDLLGTRLAHRQLANDPLGYIDFTWGQAKAYRSYRYTYIAKDGTRTVFDGPQNNLDLQHGLAGEVKELQIDSEIRPRLNIEGRLKVPYLPALIGVDFDVRNPSRDSEPNLLRFVLAFRIDAQRALGKVFGNGVTKGF